MAYDMYPPQAPAQPARPGTVTAIGVLGIVVGGLGVLALPMNIVYAATGMRAAGPMGPVMWADNGFRTYMLVSMPLSAVLSVLYIVAGMGLLRLRPWAWGLTVGLIVFAMLSQVVGAFVMLPQMARIFETAMPTMSQGAPNMSFMAPVMYVAGGISIVVCLAVMTTLLVLLTRPAARQAFQRAPR